MVLLIPSVVEVQQQVLRAARYRGARLAGQSQEVVDWNRPAKISTGEFDARHATSDQLRFGAGADGFDFGEFGHGWG